MRMNFQDELTRAQREVMSDFGDIYIDYAYDLVLLRLLAKLQYTARVVYDIGGSDGIWSALASKVYPSASYHVFEPLAEISPEYVRALAGNAYSKKLLSSGFGKMHPVALGKASGACRMTVYPGSVGSTSISLDYPVEEAHCIEVPQFRLDDYIAKNGLLAPDVLKLDTQGAELEILEGAVKALDTVNVVLCECWFFKGYGSNTPLWLDIANFLEVRGFSLFDMGWEYRAPSDQRTATKDMLFVRRGTTISPLHSYASSGVDVRIMEEEVNEKRSTRGWLDKLTSVFSSRK
jgi:FkbM family methyltransferase